MTKINEAYEAYFNENYGSKVLTTMKKESADKIARPAFMAGIEYILDRLNSMDFFKETEGE